MVSEKNKKLKFCFCHAEAFVFMNLQRVTYISKIHFLVKFSFSYHDLPKGLFLLGWVTVS